MSSDDPVTLWIDELRQADDAAAQKLGNHFVTRLYELGRKKLRPETRRVYDEEDATRCAFHSVCAGIGAGRFPDLRDRSSLWHLLVVVTARKVAHRQRHNTQQRRDVRRDLSDSIFMQVSADAGIGDVNRVVSREPTPGAIFHDCLAARPPFKGASVVDTLDEVRTQEPTTPSPWQKNPQPSEPTMRPPEAPAWPSRVRWPSCLATFSLAATLCFLCSCNVVPSWVATVRDALRIMPPPPY